MEILRFEPSHLEGIIPREPDFSGPDWPSVEIRGRFYSENGPAYTLMAKGRVIACGGVVLIHAKAGEAWVITTDEVEKYPLLFHKTIKRGLTVIMEEFKLRRVQALVSRDWPRAGRWIERLGFSNEGLMAAFGPDGTDYIRYAKVARRYE